MTRVQFLAEALKGFYLFITCTDQLWAHPASYPMVMGALSLGVKCLKHEADDHSPPSSAEVRNVWSCTSSPLTHLHGMVLN
jgi:hypothetical protein